MEEWENIIRSSRFTMYPICDGSIDNIVGILDNVTERSLVLFDELGSGTDPVEGAALAASIIESARAMGANVAATTHYAELKTFAMTTAGVENASCEFNVETLSPTYRLLIGIPGKSNAFAISRKLGLSEDILKEADDLVGKSDKDFEDVLTQLEQQRQQRCHRGQRRGHCRQGRYRRVRRHGRRMLHR